MTKWRFIPLILLFGVVLTVSDYSEFYFLPHEYNQSMDVVSNYGVLSEYTDVSNSLLYSSLIGGSGYEEIRSVCISDSGAVCITGPTFSDDFPTQTDKFNYPNGSYTPSQSDCFVSMFNTSGLVFTAFVGGTESDYPYDIAIDEEGNIYVTGFTFSSDFPTTDRFGESDRGGSCFVFKLSPTGDELLYSTIIAGNSGERAHAIAVDSFGCVYITGYTLSSDFPTVNALDSSYGGDDSDDCFITKLGPNGDELLYSTYFGGYNSEAGTSIFVDGQGCAFVGGYTWGNIDILNAYDNSSNGFRDCFVVKLSSQGNELMFSTYIGGSQHDAIEDFDIDNEGNIYATGYTRSIDFPLVNAFDYEYNGYQEENDQCFIFKLNSTGNGLLYSTYLGGSNQDIGQGIDVDAGGYVYVTGETRSSDFPTLLAYDNTSNGGVDSFLSRLSPQGDKLMFSTFVGGSGNDWTRGLAIDEYGTAYVGGFTISSDFPPVDPFDSILNGSEDCFLYKLADFSDSDNDTLTEYQESLYGTNRFSSDTDNDSLGDAEEIFLYGTSPLLADSDNDTYDDAWEIEHGFNPLDSLDPLQLIQTQQLIVVNAIATVVLIFIAVGLLLWHRARKSRMKQDELDKEERDAVMDLSEG